MSPRSAGVVSCTQRTSASIWFWRITSRDIARRSTWRQACKAASETLCSVGHLMTRRPPWDRETNVDELRTANRDLNKIHEIYRRALYASSLVYRSCILHDLWSRVSPPKEYNRLTNLNDTGGSSKGLNGPPNSGCTPNKRRLILPSLYIVLYCMLL